MFDFHFWPVFNVADIAICVGCGILVIYVLKFYEDKTNSEK
jgi:signal peptidase II